MLRPATGPASLVVCRWDHSGSRHRHNRFAYLPAHVRLSCSRISQESWPRSPLGTRDLHQHVLNLDSRGKAHDDPHAVFEDLSDSSLELSPKMAADDMHVLWSAVC